MCRVFCFSVLFSWMRNHERTAVPVQQRGGQVHVNVSVKETSVSYLLHSRYEMSSFLLSSQHASHIPLLTVSQESKLLLLCVRSIARRSSALWGADYWISASPHCSKRVTLCHDHITGMLIKVWWRQIWLMIALTWTSLGHQTGRPHPPTHTVCAAVTFLHLSLDFSGSLFKKQDWYDRLRKK